MIDLPILAGCLLAAAASALVLRFVLSLMGIKTKLITSYIAMLIAGLTSNYLLIIIPPIVSVNLAVPPIVYFVCIFSLVWYSETSPHNLMSIVLSTLLMLVFGFLITPVGQMSIMGIMMLLGGG